VALDLFAGISVSDYQRALTWYERLLGSPPSFMAHATEPVWELAEHRFVFIEEQAKDAGHAQHTVSSMTWTQLSSRSPVAALTRWR
jgi:hypothetical protein